MTETTPLDSILSGRSEPVSTTETKEVETTPAAEVEQSTPEATGSDTAETATDGQKTVPFAALHAEKQKAKRYTEQIAEFDKRMGESNAAWERRFNQLLERIPAQQQPQPEARPDFFVDPDAAIQHALQNALGPVMNRIGAMSETTSRQFAVRDHGQETVKAAYDALDARIAADPSARHEHQRIMQSGDPWGELVKWHKKESLVAEIGTDPAAYREKLKAELLAEIQPGNGAPAQPAAVMPSNLTTARNVGSRAGPAYSGPTPLADIFNRNRPAA